MNLEITSKIGQCDNKAKAPVKTWRKFPGDFNAAAHGDCDRCG